MAKCQVRKLVGNQVAERALFDRVCDFSVDPNYVGNTSSVIISSFLLPYSSMHGCAEPAIWSQVRHEAHNHRGSFNNLLVRYGQSLKDARDRLSDSAIHSGKCCSVDVLQQGIEGHYLLLGARVDLFLLAQRPIML